MNFLNDINYDKNYIIDIRDTKWTQSINKIKYNDSIINININSYISLIELIFKNNEYDYVFADNKYMYKQQKLLNIATFIDDDEDKYYNKFNYSKNFNKKIIQNGLVDSKDNISSLLYLCDYYNINIIIYDLLKDIFIQLCSKYGKNDIYKFHHKKWESVDIKLDNSKSPPSLSGLS